MARCVMCHVCCMRGWDGATRRELLASLRWRSDGLGRARVLPYPVPSSRGTKEQRSAENICNGDGDGDGDGKGDKEQKEVRVGPWGGD